ncbi:hypothetical protein [Xanthomonas sp. fls2-241-TYG-148]|uniref:hypothetical protein n=1 Tax=Xanthomonas sp. fls2-241-TYG-148 TaxID=3040328 RepID=UPI002552426E|nr:hypothetical protein [Xanthomonas sp. fls2-241-TYG-148]
MRCHGNSRLILQALPASRMLAVMLFCLANSKQQTANSKQHAAAVHQRIHYAMQLRITSLHRIPQIETWYSSRFMHATGDSIFLIAAAMRA